MNVIINGQDYTASEGESVLDAASMHGISIPTLCNYAEHENGVCRMCMVEIEGSPKLVPACSTDVKEKIRVRTDTERVENYRRTLIGLYMKEHGNHPPGQEEKCTLHEYASAYGVEQHRKVELIAAKDDSHTAISYDPSLCIGCRKCLIACNLDQNNDVISLVGRGHAVKIGFDNDIPMGSSSCTSCGACVDACPTGAIIEKDWEPANRTVVTTCPYCAVGCQIEYGITDDRIVWARGIKGLGVNDGKLCIKGKFGYGFEKSGDRLVRPLIRRGGVSRKPLDGRKIEEFFREATWDEALDLLAEKIRNTGDKYGKDSIAGVASDRSTNEDIYAFQKFMRAAVKTDNLDQSATLCHSPSAAMLSWSLGAGASTNPIHDVLNSRTIMVVGSNTDRSHPVISAYLKKAGKDGAFLIVVDPRNIELARRADLFLQIRPGTDVVLFSAMARYILENDLVDKNYVEKYSERFSEYSQSVGSFNLLDAKDITGIPAEKIEMAARIYALSKPSSIFWTLGITEHENGSDNVSSLVNLAILTGNIGIPGGGLNPIRGQNNVQGGADVGGFPGSLPGYQELLDPLVRSKFEKKWKTHIPLNAGLKSTEMIQEALAGKIRLMYLSGENSIRSHPNSSEVAEAFQKLDFLAVQDIFLNETAEYADLVLPAASSFEQYGTFTNTERRVQLVRPLFTPPGEARADWEIYADLSGRLGYDLGFNDSGDIMREISDLVPSWKGISHERLEKGGLQWPVPSTESPGTLILHRNGALRGRSRFRPVSWQPKESGEYPYVLITGRSREHYHTATMTSRSSVLAAVSKAPAIEMNRGDMAREGLKEGDKIKVESPNGKLAAEVRSNDNLQPGVMFTTFHYAGLRANILTSSTLDPITKTPAYKDTRVRITR